MPSTNRLLTILKRFGKSRILVVGDLMLDRFIWGEVERISPEAPVPVLRVTSESFRLGGAANVIHNLRTLGAKVVACGVIGRDEPGKKLSHELKKIRVSLSGVCFEAQFQTIEKSRIVTSPRHQQIVRLDRENQNGLDIRVRKKICRFLSNHGARFDAIVLSDYGKGVVHPELLDVIGKLVRSQKVACIIDPKKENYTNYWGSTLITPNKEEAGEASGIRIRDEITLEEAGKKLLEKWEAQGVLITRGQEGMSLFRRDGKSGHFPTAAREVFDVTGAGDTVVASCAVALASRATFEEAAVIANFAAGIVVGEVGTFAVPLDRLREAIRKNDRKGR